MTPPPAALPAADLKAAFARQKVQPALLGWMDGSVVALAPLSATAELTHWPLTTLFVVKAPLAGAVFQVIVGSIVFGIGLLPGRAEAGG